MRTPICLPDPGHFWFSPKAVQALLQRFPKLQALPATEVTNLAESMNAGATKLLIQLHLDDVERRQRPALLGLTTAAYALVARLDTGASAARQVAAFNWAMAQLPEAALLGIFDAAAEIV